MPNALILPNQLVEEFPDGWLDAGTLVVHLYEHPVYFTKYRYHKLKLIFHRASMKAYADFIKKKYSCRVVYISYNEKLPVNLKSSELMAIDPVDHFVTESFRGWNKISWFPNPLFLLNTAESLAAAQKVSRLGNKQQYSHDKFYRWMRKRYDVLMTSAGKPVGGKWTYDKENRKPFPDNGGPLNHKPSGPPSAFSREYIAPARKYVQQHFPNNPGDGAAKFYIPFTHDSAKKHLNEFLRDRLDCFGPYEDAVHTDVPFGCHSVLSAAINCGLLTPTQVIDATLSRAGSQLKGSLLHSTEGFLRQILGWREYVHMLYVRERERFEPTKHNEFGARGKLPVDIWYEGSREIGIPPIDDLIRKALQIGYLHHIERLMFAGGFMLITGVHPREVHDWFISIVSLDAYHWVMYPNVYGMSQHSAGPIMMNRPYFSSSAYISRMSNYPRSGEWSKTWDALYYNFIGNHAVAFRKNYAIAAQVKHWDNKSAAEKKKIKSIAARW